MVRSVFFHYMYCYYHRQGAALCPVGRVGTTEWADVSWRRSATWPLRVYSLRREEHCQGDALYPVGWAGLMAERAGFRWWGSAAWWSVPGVACPTGCPRRVWVDAVIVRR